MVDGLAGLVGRAGVALCGPVRPCAALSACLQPVWPDTHHTHQPHQTLVAPAGQGRKVTDSGIGAQSTGNRGMVSKKVGARSKLDPHLMKIVPQATVHNLWGNDSAICLLACQN